MRTFLVTGVSKGLGYELTHSLLSEGNFVCGISRTSNEKLNKIKLEFNTTFTHLELDLSSIESISEINKFITTNRIKFDCYINNAAIAYDELVTNANITDLELMFNTNVIAPIMMTKMVIKNFLLHKTKGNIIHISSISAHTGYKGLSMYASTKGAIEAFSKNVAREWGEIGIRSNCIVAGFMETDMSDKLTSRQKEKIRNRTSLKKLTDKKSVINTIKFLQSSQSDSITGQNFFVDSGTI
jgi:3-oxoacyl-[acyl-carrier protein] reductase